MIEAEVEVRPQSEIFKPRFALADLESALSDISRDTLVLGDLVQGSKTPSIEHMVWMLREHLQEFTAALGPVSSIADLEDAFTDIRYDTLVLSELAQWCENPSLSHMIWLLQDHVRKFREFIGPAILEQEH